MGSRRRRLLIETAMIVAAIVAAKFVVQSAGLDFIVLSALFSSIIAGGVFILSIILSGVITDFKESEKLPAEIATSVENIYDDAIAVHALWPAADPEPLRLKLVQLLRAIIDDARSASSEASVAALAAIVQSFYELERHGVLVNYMVRLRQEHSTIKKAVFRIQHIQRTRFLPSAYLFARTAVMLTIGLLIFTRIEPRPDALVLTAFVSYLFVFVIKLIALLDSPFESGEHSRDEVTFLLLHETIARLEESAPSAAAAVRPAREDAPTLRAVP
jgi:hypothetical protein